MVKQLVIILSFSLCPHYLETFLFLRFWSNMLVIVLKIKHIIFQDFALMVVQQLPTLEHLCWQALRYVLWTAMSISVLSIRSSALC
jgi:hypothetical protein